MQAYFLDKLSECWTTPCCPNDGPLQLTDPKEDLLDCTTCWWGVRAVCLCVCVFICVYVKDRMGEREMQWRVREIIFCSVSLCGCLCPSSILILLPWQQSSNQNISHSFHLTLSTGCPQAVCIHKLMFHHTVQPLLAILISGHIQQDSMITYTAERVWEASWFEKNKQNMNKWA